jgi:hypothetical protein
MISLLNFTINSEKSREFFQICVEIIKFCPKPANLLSGTVNSSELAENSILTVHTRIQCIATVFRVIAYSAEFGQVTRSWRSKRKTDSDDIDCAIVLNPEGMLQVFSSTSRDTLAEACYACLFACFGRLRSPRPLVSKVQQSGPSFVPSEAPFRLESIGSSA